LLTPVRIAALPRYRAPYLPRYRNTAKRVREALKEIPKAVFTAESKAVNTEISLAVFAEILLCCFTAVPRYRRA
jgi:hypothetical protein